MIHKTRRYKLVDIFNAIELAEKLSQHTWCECQAFRYKDTYYLNDSFSGNGAQEYAIFHNNKQVESVTFSWMSQTEALEFIERMDREPYDSFGECIIKMPIIDDHKECQLCR